MANSNKTVVAIGKFDGVHLGHRELLISASKLARNAGLVSVCYIIENDGTKALFLPHHREKYIHELGIDKILIQMLTDDFMNMSGADFVQKILLDLLNCAHVVVGYNFRFAKGRSADADELKSLCKSLGIECTVIPEVVCNVGSDSITASSTNVRLSLTDGDVRAASAILGRNYIISGEIVHGRHLGTTIDFPTANIMPPAGLIIPKAGVYATRVFIDGRMYPSVTNIGDNPTVSSENSLTVETNIIGFGGDIYSKEITVEFLDRIRDEKKFASLEELKNQIKKDVKAALLTK